MAVPDPQSGAQSPEPAPPKRRRRFAMPVDREPAATADPTADTTEGDQPSDTSDEDAVAVASPGPAVGDPVTTEIPAASEETPNAVPDQVQAQAPKTDGADEKVTAFREVHERRLHGFALLLTLGNRAVAADLTRAALHEAEPKVEELGHPERAAVFLRRHVLRHTPKRTEGGGRGPFRRSRPAPHQPGGISEIGADEVLVEALARLDLQARAALILQDVERLREVDVADTLGTDLRALEKLLREARTRYSQAYTAAAARHGVADSLELPGDVRRSADPGLPRHE